MRLILEPCWWWESKAPSEACFRNILGQLKGSLKEMLLITETKSQFPEERTEKRCPGWLDLWTHSVPSWTWRKETSERESQDYGVREGRSECWLKWNWRRAPRVAPGQVRGRGSSSPLEWCDRREKGGEPWKTGSSSQQQLSWSITEVLLPTWAAVNNMLLASCPPKAPFSQGFIQTILEKRETETQRDGENFNMLWG